MAIYTPNTSGIETGQPVEAAHLLNNFAAIQTSVNAIEGVQIVANTIPSDRLINVADAKIVAVNGSKITNTSIPSGKHVVGSLQTADYANASVTNVKLAVEAKAFISKAELTADAEVVISGLNPAVYQQYELYFSLEKSADNAPLLMQYSNDNGATWESTNYAVGTEAKIIGGTTTGVQNSTSESAIELALFGSSAGNGATGKVEFGQEINSDQFLGFFTTTCRRAGVTDTLVMRGGFRRFESSSIDAIKLYTATGTLTGYVLLKGIPY